MQSEEKSIGLRFFCYSVSEALGNNESAQQIEDGNYIVANPNAFDHYSQFIESFSDKQKALVSDMKVCDILH
jgi:hypothetical protein